MLDTIVRFAQPSDRVHLSRLREDLWPDYSVEHHSRELSLLLEGEAFLTMPFVIVVAQATDGNLVGFIEVGLRSHADGCDPSRPVGFIEGWYVAEHCRHKGIGRKLLIAAEAWARTEGVTEMASDTPVDNEVSQRVHQALGYTVVERCVHYRKPL